MFAEVVCCVDTVQTKAWVHDWECQNGDISKIFIAFCAGRGWWVGGILVHLMHFSSCSMMCTLDKALPRICFEN